jgi:hypothetical protein
MRNLFISGVLALGCGTLAAQPPVVRPALPNQKVAPQPFPLANPQIRPVVVVTGNPVFRPSNFGQGPLVANIPWTDPTVANPNVNNPWQLQVQPPNWNPGLPAGWNPGLPAGWNPNGPAGWTPAPAIPNPTPTPSDWSSPRMALAPSLATGFRANGAFGVNPLPVLFP